MTYACGLSNAAIAGEAADECRWAPDFVDNSDRLQDGHKLILGYNEPGESSVTRKSIYI